MRIKHEGECDHVTCKGSHTPTLNGLPTYGGWRCICPCHKTTPTQPDSGENVVCDACGYSGTISTYKPNLSSIADCRCPKCGSTDNSHNDSHLDAIQKAWKCKHYEHTLSDAGLTANGKPMLECSECGTIGLDWSMRGQKKPAPDSGSPTKSETPRTSQYLREFGATGIDWHYSASKVADFARTIERELKQVEQDQAQSDKEMCQLQDALGCPCEMEDATDKAMERIRDLIAAEGELGDAKAELTTLRALLQQCEDALELATKEREVNLLLCQSIYDDGQNLLTDEHQQQLRQLFQLSRGTDIPCAALTAIRALKGEK